MLALFLHWFIPPFAFTSGLVIPPALLAALYKGLKL